VQVYRRTLRTSSSGIDVRRIRSPMTGPNRAASGTTTSTGVATSTSDSAPSRYAAERPPNTASAGTISAAPAIATSWVSGSVASA
jgi:hypothetical protein